VDVAVLLGEPVEDDGAVPVLELLGLGVLEELVVAEAQPVPDEEPVALPEVVPLLLALTVTVTLLGAVAVEEMVEEPVRDPGALHEGAPVAVDVSVTVADAVRVGKGDALKVAVAVAAAVVEPVLHRVAVEVPEGVPLLVTRADPDPLAGPDAVAAAVPVGELEDESEKAALPEGDCALVAVQDCEGVAVATAVPVGELVDEGEEAAL
jgi:hypothetical protein